MHPINGYTIIIKSSDCAIVTAQIINGDESFAYTIFNLFKYYLLINSQVHYQYVQDFAA